MKNKIISKPFSIAALLILILVGVYLVSVMKQSNKATESDTVNITNQTSSDTSDISVTPDSSDTSGTTDNSDSSDETADWQTYTSDQYGFSFKYPNNWEYKEDRSDRWNFNISKTVPGMDIELREKGKSYSVEASDVYAIGIFVENSSTSKTPLQILVKDRPQPALGETVDINSIIVGGLDAAQLENYIQKTTVVVKNKIEYHISTPEFGSDTEDQPIRDIYDQILSTFKFTD